MSQCRERSEHKKISGLASMNIICIYLIYKFMSQAYMFDTAQSNAYPISLSDFIAY